MFLLFRLNHIPSYGCTSIIYPLSVKGHGLSSPSGYQEWCTVTSQCHWTTQVLVNLGTQIVCHIKSLNNWERNKPCDLCDTSETLPRWDESSNRQEGNKWKHLKNISHKNTFYKALFTKAGVNLNLSWGSIQPGRTGLPTKTSFLPVTMLCGHAKAWEITFLGGTGYLMWYIWWEGPIHQKSPWCWQRLKAKGEEGVRGWDGWIASLTQGTWPWANSGG